MKKFPGTFSKGNLNSCGGQVLILEFLNNRDGELGYLRKIKDGILTSHKTLLAMTYL